MTDHTTDPTTVEQLREARIGKGLTLDDLALITKISPKLLTALETGDIDGLPAAVFTRGFVKAYAREVGLDPDRTADLYQAQLKLEIPTADAEIARLKVATDARSEVETPQAGRISRLMFLAAVIGLVAYVGRSNWDGWPSLAGATGVFSSRPADTAPAATTPATPTEAAPAAVAAAADMSGGPLQFVMNAQGPCWLSTAADGNRVRSELLQAGDNRIIEVSHELVLRVGDAGACAFSINGRAGRPLGSPGAPVTVTITKDNFRGFLS